MSRSPATGVSGARGARGARVNVERALERGRRALAARSGSDARRESGFLLAGVLGVSPAVLWLDDQRQLSAPQLVEYERRLERRAGGEPLQYVEGRAAFRNLNLRVNRSVLIPRPETEQLVDRVLEWSAGRADLSFLDIGTGSGAIALSLLTEGPFERGVTVDISADALKVAGQNAVEVGVESRVDFRVGAFPDAVRRGERFHVIVSNPPYVALGEADGLPAEVRDWEPREALFAGPTGLEVIERIVEGAAAHLEPEGLLALEVSPAIAEAAASGVRASGVFREPRVARDLAERARFILSELSV
ncbi:MAG: peptide chain release factor N(5)-glutamine methyltransferase [Gemmatimonadota bacterium]|nr:peptide chain release factor N(5)-glutamine methyltransferase [Candidatus Palauibacterales bacterium]